MHVSICLLSFNRAEFFWQSFLSLEQSLKNSSVASEIIVNDDCSTDERVSELLYKLYKDGRVSSLILNAAGTNSGNQGVGASFIKAFGVSSGKYVVKADVDLLYRFGWLDECVSILENIPNISNVGGFHYFHDPVDAKKMYQEVITVNGVTAEKHKDSVGSLMAMPRKLLEQYHWQTHSSGFAEDFVWKRQMEDRGFFCALPVNDFCQNQGFGLGRSTVCYADSNSENGIAVTKIHTSPALFP